MSQDVHAHEAPDLSALRADILRASRFLGVHQGVWGVVLGSLAFACAFLTSAAPAWTWLVFAVGAWLVVELAFLPRRREARRLAEYQRRQEITRIAMARGAPSTK